MVSPAVGCPSIALSVAANDTPATPGPATTKPQLYRSYRPQPPKRCRHRRCSLCCYYFWTILLLLFVALLATIAGAALYVLYHPHPHRPTFSLSSLRTIALNLTTTSNDSASCLTALFNLTLICKNPNAHTFTFFYDPFTVSLSLASGFVPLGNGLIPSFTSYPKNQTTLRTVASTSWDDVDAGLALKILMGTKVRVKAGGRKSKKVRIRVVCGGIKGVSAPRDKNATVVANVAGSKCKVDLLIKMWRFTF